ncbi:hypothetical protein DL771_006248 [Monosporascus sp. 5C6A]|nr:hypothetical protein DL771_006248 [Monosporascus sp. 5C6A]
MADAFGIIGVIGVAVQIIQMGIQFGLDWKDAPADVKNFIAELQVLKTTLSETNTNIALNPDFINAFQGRHSTVLSQLTDVTPATDTSVMVSACRTELEHLVAELKKRAQGHQVGWERMKGAFLAKKTREAVENLQRQCQFLNDLVVIDSAALQATILKEVREGTMKQQAREAADERDAILHWLTPVDYAPQQSDFINRRQVGTGQWLLDSPEFQAWVKTDKQTLFCHGMPGAGKTILTSIVVDELMARFGNDKGTGIAYIYCNFRRQEEQKAGDLFASLLKQLAQGRSSLPDSVKSLHDKYKTKRTRPPFADISVSLQSLAAEYSRVFIVVDALDECQASDGCRTKLLSELFSLQAKCALNIFATSRYNIIAEMSEESDSSMSLEIRATDEDVRTYLDSHISHLPAFVRNRFLLAQLHFDSLKGKRSPKAIRAALKNLATGSDAYDRAYDEAMERIEGQLKDEKELAKQALYWITCAKRPLTTIELQHALAVEVGEPELDPENLTTIHDIVSGKWFPNATTEIATVCATYLSFSAFERRCLTAYEFEHRLQSNPLYIYAATNWGHHAREASTFIQEVIDFLECDAKVEASSRPLMFNEYGSQTVPSYVTGLHLAAYFGVYEAAKVLSRGEDVDFKDSGLRTPLALAAECGHEAVVKLLLEKGADIESKFNLTSVQLLLAVKSRYGMAFEVKLEKGVNSKFMLFSGEAPLSSAAQYGHEAVVKMLLEKDANINSKSAFGRIPLSLAAINGHGAVVKLLLERGADIEWKDNEGRTPLSSAALYGHEAVVKLLLEKGADIESKDNEGRTPLPWTVISGHEAVINMLLEKGADIESKDKDGRTPLSLAVIYGYEAVAEMLIETGAAIKSESIFGRLQLSSAAIDRHKTVVNLLLEKGADVNSKDKDGRTPLSWALQSGNGPIIKQLQTQGITG